MIEFLATALAAFMIPAAPMSTVAQLTYEYDKNDNVELAQVMSNDIAKYDGYDTVTVKTPNGSDVSAIVYSNEMSDYYRGIYDEYFDKHPERNLNPIYKSNATLLYGPFAYAFYMQWSDNPIDCWLKEIDTFIKDKSFIEVETPQVNDVILYVQDNYTNGVYKPIAVHSGIVTEVYNTATNGVCGSANTVKVKSKWGYMGVYEHRGDECPYTSPYGFQDDENYLDFSEAATRVVYYRRHPKGHNYSEYNYDSTTHTYKCICGETGKTEAHKCTDSYIKKDRNYHYANCKCGYSIQQKHSWRSLGNKYMLQLLGLNEDFSSDPLGVAPREWVICVSCKYSRALDPDEIIAVPLP